jgi:ankyrin repeat protein
MKLLSIFLLSHILFIYTPINSSDFHNNNFPYSTTHRYPTRQTYKYQDMFLSGDIKQMNEALQNRVNRNCIDKYGNTALHLAAYRRNYDQIKSLIDLHVNRCIKNNAGLTFDNILRKNQETGCIDIRDDLYFKKVMQEEYIKIIQNLPTCSNHK